MELNTNAIKTNESKCHNVDEHGRKAIITMNKKKYFEMEKHLREFTEKRGIDEETLVAMCDTICKALAFNPELKAYKVEEVQRRHQEKKQKLAENGMNTYDAYGRAYYEANREECAKRNAMYKAAQRTATKF